MYTWLTPLFYKILTQQYTYINEAINLSTTDHSCGHEQKYIKKYMPLEIHVYINDIKYTLRLTYDARML